jgi:membrane associated rhomboid family serine protease
MIIPWNTDAPIYHFPFATIGLIVANTAAFVAILSAEDPFPWLLSFGDGLHPAQWVTNVFLHADLTHLLGNMIFLWGFGLVIEGKVGWWRFLLIYLGLGVFESAVSQIAMLGSSGFALGASGAIYGLLAMALVWAPRNDMNCVAFFGFRFFSFDFPILGFVTLYVGWEVVALWLNDFQMSSAMLHLAGALPGFAIAAVMVKTELVDCENWDIFAVMGQREGQKVAKKKKVDHKQVAARQEQRAARLAAATRQFQHSLAAGHGLEALAIHERAASGNFGWQLDQPARLALIKALHQEKAWSQSILPMVDYLRDAADGAPRVRLRLAQILITTENRPGRALSVLEKIPAGSLAPDLEKTRRQLESQARKRYDQGEIETEDEDW